MKCQQNLRSVYLRSKSRFIIERIPTYLDHKENKISLIDIHFKEIIQAGAIITANSPSLYFIRIAIDEKQNPISPSLINVSGGDLDLNRAGDLTRPAR